MDLLSLIMILVRRWYVFLLVTALTLAALTYVYPRLKPDYQATGTLLVVLPNSQTQLIQSKPAEIPVNPLLSANNAMMMTAATLTSEGNSDAEQQLMTNTYGLTYTITVDGRAPLITVQGTAKSQDAAIQGVAALLGFMADQLNVLQRTLGAPPDQLMTSNVIDSPKFAVVLNSSRNKVIFILAFVGLLVASSLSFIVDGILVGKRARKRRWARAMSPYPEPAVAAGTTRPFQSPVAMGAAAGNGEERVAWHRSSTG
jgi:capsular polysaccharide biosynthesis protein